MAGESIQKIGRGDPAPEFTLTGTDEETHSLEDFSDHEAILIVFTCNHCPYAQAKFDLLNRLAAEYDDVAVVGINANDADTHEADSFEAMQEMVADGTIQYDAYLFDETQETAKEYGAVCTPDPFLFDVVDGTTELAYHGRLDDALNPNEEPTHIEIEDAIESVLAGEDVELDFNPSRGCTIKWRPGNEPAYWEDI